MTEPSRRGFLTGLGVALVGLAAPAVIRRQGILMPIKAEVIYRDWIASYAVGTDTIVYTHRWIDGVEHRAIDALVEPTGRGERVFRWTGAEPIPPPARPSDPRAYFYATARAAGRDNYVTRMGA